MKSKRNLIIWLVFIFGMYIAAENSVQNTLLLEYEAVYNAVKYAKQCGFCYDGINRIAENKTEGSEHSFFVEEENIYLKVIHTTTKETYFTRCFDIKEINGILAINPSFRLKPQIIVDGHWKFSKIGKNLTITVCNDTSCRNIAIPLFEVTEKPEKVMDGIFFSFKEQSVKKPDSIHITLNAKAVPLIHIAEEQATMKTILKKMEQYFTASQIKEKEAEFNQLLKIIQ